MTTLFDPSTASATAPSVNPASTNRMALSDADTTVFSVETPKDLNLDDRLAGHLEDKMSIAKLTECQKQTIPYLMKRQDGEDALGWGLGGMRLASSLEGVLTF